MATAPPRTRHRRFRRLLPLAVASLLAASGLVTVLSVTADASTATISNGVQNDDQNGNNVQGHGGTVVKAGSAWYWLGEDDRNENGNSFPFQHIPCYSSTDLAHWTYVGEALNGQPSGDLGPGRIVERPKVVYNSSTRMYVMYLHIDTSGFGTGKVGVADSPNVCGPYNYLGSFLPDGNQSWDIGLFKASNGTAYLLSHGSSQLHIYQLSSDYLSVVGQVAALTPDLEAPAMFQAKGHYFLFGSNLTGWNFNDDEYTSATSLSGPWSSWHTFAPVGSDTYSSQADQVLTLQGSGGTTYTYMGDRWNSGNLGNSTYVWLPLKVAGASLSLPHYYDTWTLNASNGTWSGTPSHASATEFTSAQSGKCLDDPDASETGGTQFDIWACHHGQNQEFTYEWGTLRYLKSFCLDVSGDSWNAGTKVDVWPCNGGNNQQWTVNGNGTITANSTGFCLDVTGQGTADGTGVDVTNCNGQANQQWSKA